MKKVRVYLNNNQKEIEVTKDIKDLIYFCCCLVLYLEKFKNYVEISVLLTDNIKIQKLNLKYKNKNKPTDVLSFPMDIHGKYTKYNSKIVVLGDIVISVERALSQIEEFNSCCIEEELARLVVHSMLHLLGYDHEKGEEDAKIKKKKERIINKIILNKFKFERDNVL